MLNIIEIYSTLQAFMGDWHTRAAGDWPLICMILSFTVLSVFEFQRPKLRLRAKEVVKSYCTNLGLFVFNSLMISAFSIAGLSLVLEHFSGKGWLSGMPNSAWKALLSFLLLDFLLYAWHRVCHQFDGLWMFHKVHHSDPHVNVSTAFRIHIVELMITTLLKSMYIVLLGIDKTVVFAYEAVYPLFVMFHHTNSALPGEKWLGQVVITPRLHRAHHSIERKEHDSNYGAVFSVWDRLFLSRKEVEPAGIGIKGASPQTVWGLVKFGFTDTAQSKPALAYARTISANVHAMIAEAAYYRAEKRAFSPGFELCDWLEAKREILQQVYGDPCMNCR